MATRLPPSEYLKFWDKALEQEMGLLIEVVPEDQHKMIKYLYEARDPVRHANLMIFQPKPEGTIFISKKTAELPE